MRLSALRVSGPCPGVGSSGRSVWRAVARPHRLPSPRGPRQESRPCAAAARDRDRDPPRGSRGAAGTAAPQGCARGRRQVATAARPVSPAVLRDGGGRTPGTLREARAVRPRAKGTGDGAGLSPDPFQVPGDLCSLLPFTGFAPDSCCASQDVSCTPKAHRPQSPLLQAELGETRERRKRFRAQPDRSVEPSEPPGRAGVCPSSRHP